MLTQKELQTIHFKNLQAIAPKGLYTNDEKKFMRRIRTLENRANRAVIAYCNGDIDGEEYKQTANLIEKQVAAAFCAEPPDGFFINGDPRGYQLKLRTEFVRHIRQQGKNIFTDWGGYGILSPSKF